MTAEPLTPHSPEQAPALDPAAMLIWQSQQIQEHAAKLSETVQRVTGLEQGYLTLSGWQEREAGKTLKLETDVGTLQSTMQIMVSTTQKMHSIVEDVQRTLSDWAPRGIKIDQLLEETANVAERQEWALQAARDREAEKESRRRKIARGLGLLATLLTVIGSLGALVTTAAAWGPWLQGFDYFVSVHQLTSAIVVGSVVVLAGALWLWWLWRAGQHARAGSGKPKGER